MRNDDAVPTMRHRRQLMKPAMTASAAPVVARTPLRVWRSIASGRAAVAARYAATVLTVASSAMARVSWRPFGELHEVGARRS